MLARYLLPEHVARQDGSSSEVSLGSSRGKLLLLTLGITRIAEQESLELSFWGSADRENWKRLTTFPKKSYCGTYPLLLDLKRHPEVGYLRAEWRLSCWDQGEGLAPLCGFYVTAEEPKFQAVGA